MPADHSFFVDTNVLLYSVDPSDAEKQKRAWLWLKLLWERAAGRLSWQVLHEFYANAGPELGVERSQAQTLVRGYAKWQPLDTSIGLIERAWHWSGEAQLSYWDALIVAAAERAGCGWLLSEDFQNGRMFGSLRVVNPFLEDPAGFGLR